MPNSIDILERLIAFDTVSRTPNSGLMAYVQDVLAGAGVECELIGTEDGANANLYATVGPRDRGGVMLSGHTDVVPVEGQAWTVDPFRLIDRDGRLYGRGTADMKGFVACAVCAMVNAAGRELETPLHLALSYDEEIGCVGVRRMLDVLDAAPVKPAICIVGEPTGLEVASGHKGKTAALAVCRGLSVHSALAPTGINAIHLGVEFVAALRDIQADLASKGTLDADYDIPYTTVHAGTIRGGTALNIVPDQCVIEFEVRHVQADDPDEIFAGIRETAARIADTFGDGGSIGIEIVNSYPGLDTPLDAEVVSFVKSLTGRNSTTKIAFGTEGGLFSSRLGIPTVVCGPGSMAQGHKPDEFIERTQIEKCDAMLETLIARLSA